MNDRKLNVCLLNDSFPPSIDGVARTVVNYADVINTKLGEATVATPRYPGVVDEGYNFDVIRYPSVNTMRLIGYRAGNPFSVKLLDDLSQRDFDIIHSHCPAMSTFIARSLRQMTDKPIVFTYHTKFAYDIATMVSSETIQKKLCALVAANISGCDEVWAVSRGAGENMKLLGYQGDYIVMPNGVDFPCGRLDEDKVRELTSYCPLPEGVPIFLYVGRMMWYKGIQITLDAIKMLEDAGRDFRMVFVGGGADKDAIEKKAEAMGLKKVIFCAPTNSRDLIRAWYSRADLFLFPSTYDTNGLVVREASACGLASVLVEGSCAAEDSTNNVDTLLIEENPESMYKVVSSIMDKPEELRKLGEMAMKNLYLSWEDAVKQAYERYGVVIENYKSHAGETPIGKFNKFSAFMADQTELAVAIRRFIAHAAKGSLDDPGDDDYDYRA